MLRITPESGWRLGALALVVLGSATSGHLLGRTWSLLGDRGAGSPDVCSALFGRGCDATLLAESSWQLGIPLAGWGLVFYSTVVALLALAWWLGAAFKLEATLAALLIAVLGACASVTLAAQMLTGRVPLCPLCLVVQASNLALVPVLQRLSGRSSRELVHALQAGLAYLLGREAESKTDAPWKVVGFITAALVAAVTYQWVYVETALRRAAATAEPEPEEVLRAFQAASKQELLTGADDPRLGPADAPVQMVVFISFQCPACAELARELRRLVAEFPGELSVVVKHFPLGKACNPALQVDKQPRACDAAWAAEAARLQNRFWPFHDALFQSDLAAEGDTLARLATETGLDLARLESDRVAPATHAKVRADIDLASRLGVAETPAIFIDGRRVRRWSPAALRVLIAHERSTAAK